MRDECFVRLTENGHILGRFNLPKLISQPIHFGHYNDVVKMDRKGMAEYLTLGSPVWVNNPVSGCSIVTSQTTSKWRPPCVHNTFMIEMLEFLVKKAWFYWPKWISRPRFVKLTAPKYKLTCAPKTRLLEQSIRWDAKKSGLVCNL